MFLFPVRSYYRGALCKVLEQGTGRTEAGGESVVQEIPTVAGELLAMMSGDWERRVVEADVVWLALHLARYMYVHIHIYMHTCMCVHVYLLETGWA